MGLEPLLFPPLQTRIALCWTLDVQIDESLSAIRCCTEMEGVICQKICISVTRGVEILPSTYTY